MFTDPRQAGKEMMPLVKQYAHEIDLVLALPPGGQEVAAAIAAELGKPMEQVEDAEVQRNMNLAGQGVLLVAEAAANENQLSTWVQNLRRAGAQPVGVAVPVASIDVVSVLEDQTDYFLALETPAQLD